MHDILVHTLPYFLAIAELGHICHTIRLYRQSAIYHSLCKLLEQYLPVINGCVLIRCNNKLTTYYYIQDCVQHNTKYNNNTITNQQMSIILMEQA